jgi:hypothetical protein
MPASPELAFRLHHSAGSGKPLLDLNIDYDACRVSSDCLKVLGDGLPFQDRACHWLSFVDLEMNHSLSAKDSQQYHPT